MHIEYIGHGAENIIWFELKVCMFVIWKAVYSPDRFSELPGLKWTYIVEHHTRSRYHRLCRAKLGHYIIFLEYQEEEKN